MRPAYSVATVRAAEAALMQHQCHEDELMRLAARGVATTAKVMLDAHGRKRLLVLAGPGGNGGDGLYAAAFLRDWGYEADAVLVTTACHEPARAAAEESGATIWQAADFDVDSAQHYNVIVDAIAGLASARPIDKFTQDVLAAAALRRRPILSVDMPTGIDAESGTPASESVSAQVTVTFGWARAGHAFAPECGQVVVCDLQLPDGPVPFSIALEEAGAPVAHIAYEPSVRSPYQWPTAPALDGDEGLVTAPKPVGCTGPIVDPTPGIHSNKYTGGVATICAGSARYVGAGILATAGAVGASPAMVQVVGQPEIVHHFPEAVRFDSVNQARRTQTWVIGPGRGTDEHAKLELINVLSRREPVVIDADALRIIAGDTGVQKLVREHPFAVLTPHFGEFSSLYDAMVGSLDPTRGRGTLLRELADALDCFVMLKGRITHVTAPGFPVYGVDAGHSFSATPGSGDVLAGVLGAVLAQQFFLDGADTLTPGDAELAIMEILHANSLHIHAAAIAAETPDGYGVATASKIAAALPQAVARLNAMAR